jgi:hypothetical protein
MVSTQRPLNTETQYEYGVINDLKDPLLQGRVKISTASLAQVDIDSLPWAKSMTNHSQLTNQQGSTKESAHSFKRGDVILVYRPTASEQDWMIAGHPSTITGANQS